MPSTPRLSLLSYYCFFPWFYELAAFQIQPDTPALTILSKRAASRMNGQGVWPGEIRWRGQLVCNNCIESWTLKVQSHLKWAMPVGAEMRYSDWPGVHGTGCWVGWNQMNKGCQHSWASPRHMLWESLWGASRVGGLVKRVLMSRQCRTVGGRGVQGIWDSLLKCYVPMQFALYAWPDIWGS